MTFRRWQIALLIMGTIAATGALAANERPNVLIIMADDCTFNDLPVYGGKNAKTPNIDKLATQGLVFDRAYLAEAMCQPCRAELYSGQFPMTNGCAWNHSASRPDTTSMPHHLGGAGYRVGLAGKVHVKPAAAFPFEKVEGFDPRCTRNPTQRHDTAGILDFMTNDKSPFCLVVALVEPHVPWVMGDASAYPPAKIDLPPNLADTEKTRHDFGTYLAEVTYMDGQVGKILEALDASGQAANTLVLFTSEQGSQFPGNKWTNWDTGVHTALIARWPGKVTAGKRTDAIVQYADVLPTLLELAGKEGDDPRFDGSSFLPVLLGEKAAHREFAYGIHNQVPEGPPYPVRTVTDGEYRYIRNLSPEELFIEKHLMGLLGGGARTNPYWPTWMAETADNPETYRLVRRYQSRPAEELYHTKNDPYEMTNLAESTERAKIKAKLSAALDRWMKSQGDPGVAQDTTKALNAARKGNHLFGPWRND